MTTDVIPAQASAFRPSLLSEAREFISWFTLKFTMNGRLDGASPRAGIQKEKLDSGSSPE